VVAESRAGDAIPGEYIVTFRDSVQDVPGVARRTVAEGGGSLRFVYTAALKGFAAHLPLQAVEALRRNPRVARIEQDVTLRAAEVQNRPPWALDRLDQRTLPFDQVYSYAGTGAGVSTYIIDSGIRTTHREFEGRAAEAFTAINDGRGAQDCAGHGTHVAGIIGGKTFGVAKGVRLYSLRVFDCQSYGASSGTIAAVDWVTRNRVLPAVANMSLTSSSSTLAQAVQASINAGVVYVAAAGNNSGDACSYVPANVTAVVTVGSSNSADQQSAFSNGGSCVDLFAPGELVKSAYITSDSSTAIYNGTSQAAPHAAGVAALYLAANPSAAPATAHQSLVDAATTGLLTNVTSRSPNRLLFAPAWVGAPSQPVASEPAPAPGVDAPPYASFSVSCPGGRSRCNVDASASNDDAGIVNYTWNFGDGIVLAAGAAVTHTHRYAAPGTFVVTLTVTDAAGHTGTVARTVTVRRL
jgi:serine protease